MPLNLNLNQNPYFDDYNSNNQYYRVLFKPATAVQARELTTLQSMLQNQIELFGNWAFQNGDIVYGCPVSDIPSLQYVRLADALVNGASYNVTNYVNTQVVSLQSNLTARVVYATQGISSNYPNTNVVYIIYTNTGSGGQQTFSNTDQLSFINIASNSVMGTVNTYIANSVSNTYTTGSGHGISVGQGVAFLNGIFVNVLQPTIGIVNAYGTNAGNTVVGFVLNESIINANEDSSLYDNALGYGNQNAPGADRLQLSVGLLAINSSNVIANTTGFNPIAVYNYGALVSSSTTNNQLYSIVGNAVSQGIYNADGNYVVNPFSINTLTYSNSIVQTANSQTALLVVSPGEGYAMGNLVQIQKTAYVNVRRGIDTYSATSQNITFNYGGYFLLDEVAGAFNFSSGSTVTFYNQAQQAVTNQTFNSITPAGTPIGTAYAKCMTYLNGPVGTNTAVYALHLFNINMYSGYNVNQIGSVYYNGSIKGIGDLLPGTGFVENTSDDQLYSFGVSGLKNLRSASGTNATEFVYRSQNTVTMTFGGSTGTASYTITTGNDQVSFGVGQIPDNETNQFIVINTANAQSSNLAGNTTVYNTNNFVLGVGTNFTQSFSNGSQILVGSAIRTVTQVINSTAMTVNAPFPANTSLAAYYRYYSAGKIFNILSTASDIPSYFNVTNSSSFSLNMTFNGGTVPTTSLNLDLIFNVLRTNAVPASKIINKNRFVKIDTTSNPNGPWCLGYSDVHQVTGVYSCTSPSYSTSNPNVTSNFVFDSGATDSSYGLGYLYPTTPVTANTYLLVQLDYFSVNTTPGYGFFTVESYPIDDVNTANQFAITTYNIPLYVDESGNQLYLRDYVDFRPPVMITANDTGNCVLSNTIQVSASIAAATTINAANPANTITYITPYITPAWGQNLQANYTLYLPRQDLLYITPSSNLYIKEGVSAINPQPPLFPDNAMAVSVINIPPYPSLTSDQLNIVAAENKTSKNLCRSTNNVFATNLVTNRRYTMADIGALDNRISSLENYAALSLLQSTTQNITVVDSNGIDRFKNGIFADPLNNFTYSSVSDPSFSMAIDLNNGGGRPKIIREHIKVAYNSALSNAVQQTGRVITLPYTEQSFILQPYATAYRSSALVAYSWSGTLSLIPCYDNQVDTTTTAAAQITVNNASAWQQIANSPFGIIYGDWNTTASSTACTTVTGTTSTTVTSTTTTSTQTNQQLSVQTVANTVNVGNYVTSVSLQPYMASAIVSFYAYNMRPNQLVHIFFNSINVDQYCAPGVRNASNGYIIYITNSSDHTQIQTNGTWGTSIYTDSNGTVAGQFNIPAGTFQTGTTTLEIADVSSLILGQAAITTLATAQFTSSYLAVTQQTITLTTVNPVISFIPITNTVTSTATSVSTVNLAYTPPPTNVQVNQTTLLAEQNSQLNGNHGGTYPEPLAQTFMVNTSDGSAGVFATSIVLYFNQTSLTANSGVTVYICDTNNGYPDTESILPFSTVHLPMSSINVSANATVGTKFTFESPVYMGDGQLYAFIVKPDNNDPDYQVWYANIGNIDVSTNNQVYSQPAVGGTAFYGATTAGWTALQTEYVKFNLNVAQFQSNGGDAYFNNAKTDFIPVYNIAYTNTSLGLLPGDYVYSATNSTPSTVNTSVYGILDFYDPSKGYFYVANSTGNFGSTSYVQIHRFANSSVATPNSSTIIASANTSGLYNPVLDSLVTNFSVLAPAGTSVYFDYAGTSNSYSQDSNSQPVILGGTTSFTDKERIVASRSNEVAHLSSNSSMTIHARFSTSSQYLSPIIDTVKNKQLVIANYISNTGFDYTEYFNNGLEKTKYISQIVTLAAGQDAQDLQVILTVYRPPGTDVVCYGRFLNQYDTDPISKKPWTLLLNGSANTYSSPSSNTNFISYTYTVPLIQPSANAYISILPGNVTIANTSNTVTGTGTSFTSNLQIGWYVTMPGNSTFIEQTRQVVYITNATSLQMNAPFYGNYTANQLYLVPPPTTAWVAANTLVQVMGNANVSTTNNSITSYSASIVANNTVVSNTTGFITITNANTYLYANQELFYFVPSGNTAIPGLTGNSFYYVAAANTTGITLSNTMGGVVLSLNASSTSTETHYLQTTVFSQQFSPGTIVSILGDEQTVVSVSNNTYMTVGIPWTSSGNFANVYIQTNAGLTYLNGNSALFNSFNQFQIKAVLQSNSSAQVPLLQSVQGLALMV